MTGTPTASENQLAWALIILLLGIGAIVSLAKGFDYEEATILTSQLEHFHFLRSVRKRVRLQSGRQRMS